MKKIKTIFLVVLTAFVLVFGLAGCCETTNSHYDYKEDKETETTRFVLISKDTFFKSSEGSSHNQFDIYIVYDSETRVMYAITMSYNGIGIEVMVDSDGKPLKYKR